MFARTSLILTLILSLLLTAQALPVVRSVVTSDPAQCGEVVCVKGCCQSKACCEASQQQAPPSPTPVTPRAELQLAPIDFRIFALLYALPTATRDFIIVDEVNGGHALPPLAVSCIRLI